jgi:pimeloyl-ACP methyl ester carboxylesterase
MFDSLRHVRRISGLTVKDHVFELPLDHADPSAGSLEVFAREIVLPDRDADHLPWLVFLQGGPGFGSPRPLKNSGWIKRATQEFRVLLLDQRGTGLSTPVSQRTLAHLPDPEAQAAYLEHFRADSIVEDAEAIRRQLCGDKPWTVLGQSYGGFCLATYLSFHPEGLSAGLFTGGVPMIAGSIDEIYRRTYPRVVRRNQRYYARYPEDMDRVSRICRALDDDTVKLPGGDRLTSRRFLQLGLQFGFSGGFETVHYLVESAFVNGPDGAEFSWPFLRDFHATLSYDTHPIFSVLHEAAYAQGEATRWSAQRLIGEFPEFAPDHQPPFFTGEMIYPWQFEEIGELSPLGEAAEILAAKVDWPALYDPDRLACNTVPCVAAIYDDDMYVDSALSRATGEVLGGLDAWITNEYDHDALRSDGHRLLSELLDRVRGRR